MRVGSFLLEKDGGLIISWKLHNFFRNKHFLPFVFSHPLTSSYKETEN